MKKLLPHYIGTKNIGAEPMTLKAYYDLRGWVSSADENQNDDGYLVMYPDQKPNHPDYPGYISWSPKAVFEAAYQDVTKGCTFGHAVVLLKEGFKVARKGWNGKGMYISYVAAEEWASSELERPWSHDLKPIPWIGMKTVDDTYVPWLASQSDILAEDWVLAQ